MPDKYALAYKTVAFSLMQRSAWGTPLFFVLSIFLESCHAVTWL